VIPLSEDLFSDYKHLNEELKKIDAQNECSLYVLSAAFSTEWSINRFNE